MANVTPNQNQQREIWSHYQNQGTEHFSASAPRLNAILKLAIKKTRSSVNPSLLNIGAGNGYLELKAKSHGFKTHSLDLSPETVLRLQKSGIQAVEGSMTQMPFADASFDIVIATEVLEHLTKDDLSLALSEVKRILKPNGHFIGSVPYEENLSDNQVFCPQCQLQFHRWGHQQSFSILSLQTMLQTCFHVRKITSQSFVDWDAKSFKKFMKTLIRSLLGHFGVMIAQPNIVFVCQR